MLFLISAVVLFTLFFTLIQQKSKTKARKSYNYFILSSGFWILSDLIEYSSSTELTALIAMIFSYFFISITLFFLAKTIFELEKEKNDWLSLIPLSFFILLFPFFQVKQGFFVKYVDLMNMPLLIFSFVELFFFLFLVFNLFKFKNKIKSKETRFKLSYLAYSLLFIVVFNFSYFMLSSFYPLPPLTWFSALIFSGVTYPLFKD